MSLEENKEIIRSLSEVLNERNLALLDELMTPNFFHHTLRIQGLESFKQDMTLMYKGFPDFHVTIEDITAEGDKVWVRVKETGTHKGEYRGLAPTGKKITYTAVAIFRIVDGKIVEGWGVYDMLDFYKQLGVIEYKGFPDEVK
jgi:hypothetical protein